MTLTYKASEPDLPPTDGSHPGFHIDQIDSNRGAQDHYAKITIWGDEALRDRILAFLNTEPVKTVDINDAFVCENNGTNRVAVYLVPVSP